MTVQRAPIPGPWKGIITDLPSGKDPLALDDMVNIFARKGRLQSRPRWSAFPSPPDGQPIRIIYTFQDFQANFHTIVVTDDTAYFIFPVGFPAVITYFPLTTPSGITNLSGNGFMSFREMNNQFYFCNGVVPILYSDGSQLLSVAGNVPGACLYMTENSESLIGVNWIEPPPTINGSQKWPFRVRWSDTGDPTQWQKSDDTTAGALDLIESGGALTGCGTIGRNTYITRRYGATVMYPTGNANNTFATEPYLWSNPGWGNFYPFSLVTWGPLMLSIAESAEVLMFDGSNFTRLASGKIRTQLARDLAMAASPNDVYGFGTSSMGPGYDLEAYWISIPASGKIWVHDLVEGTWQRLSSSAGFLTQAFRVATS